ncbi:MAG: glycerophosphodiester phosphodiesterase [Candidatus Kariarchaeaceae archaeon]
MKIACIAHRGASGVAPENTMLAFWTAISSNADMIELDVQITKDRELVIFHDRSLSRITGEDEGIADFTLFELKKKDVGIWKNELFAGTRIPTFVEVLSDLPKNTSLIVEVKPQNHPIENDRLLERRILDNLDDERVNYGVGLGYISVRDEETFEWFNENTSKYSIGLMQKKRSVEEFLTLVKEYKIQFSQIRPAMYKEDDFTQLSKTGTKIIVFYADYPTEWDYFIRNNVSGILTNYPSLLSGYLKLRNLSSDS